MHSHSHSRSILVLGGALALALAAPAAAHEEDRLEITSSSVSVPLDDRGTVFDESRTVHLEIRVRCRSGDRRFVQVTLTQRDVVGRNAAEVECDEDEDVRLSVRLDSQGDRRDPWRPGRAVAEASMVTDDGVLRTGPVVVDMRRDARG